MANCKLFWILAFLTFASIATAQVVKLESFDAHPESRVPVIYNGVVYNCDFESEDKCNIDTYGQLNKTSFFFTNRMNYTQYKSFSDMSSISEVTSNGKNCQIPYTYFGDPYYFCNSDLECQTSSGFAKCKNGYFLGGILKERNESQIIYFGQVANGQMNVNMYELTFYAFIFCQFNRDCKTADDKIRVYLFNGISEYEVVEIKYSDFEGETKWKKFSVQIGNVYDRPNLRFEFYKDPDFNQLSYTYFGIDNIKIAYSSEDPRRVTKCDFDKNHCTLGGFYRNQTFIAWRNQMQTSLQNTIITDVTSTTTKARNGEFCQFPFTFNDKEYSFCTESNQCLTSQGMSDCAEGRFVGGYLVDPRDPDSKSVRVSFYARPISFTKYGNFRLTFNSFMFCDAHNDSCLLNNDYLTVTADATTKFEKSFDLKYYQDTIGWKKTSIDLYILPYDRLWISFLFNRTGVSSLRTYYGLDEIELTYLDELDPDQFPTTSTQAKPITTSGQFKTAFAKSVTLLGVFISFIAFKFF